MRARSSRLFTLALFGCLAACSSDSSGLDSGRGDRAVADASLTDGAHEGISPDRSSVETGSSDSRRDSPVTTVSCKDGWCSIPGGTYTMGSPVLEPCRDSDETPHLVSLTHAFEILQAEVSQSDFEKAVSYNQSQNKTCGATCPVEWVTWAEAAAYCNALSTKAGLTPCYQCTGSGSSIACSEAAAYGAEKVYSCPGYRLPTEAEWEYAYRAGTTTAYYNGDNDPKECSGKDPKADLIGWYDGNSGDKTHPPGQLFPNPWGLVDMAGNVWEWCHDKYAEDLTKGPHIDPWGDATGEFRVTKGGGYDNSVWYLRGGARYSLIPTLRYPSLGFRVARTLTP